MPGDFAQLPVSLRYHSYYYPSDVTEVMLGASGHWLGTRVGTDGGNKVYEKIMH